MWQLIAIPGLGLRVPNMAVTERKFPYIFLKDLPIESPNLFPTGPLDQPPHVGFRVQQAQLKIVRHSD